ncbi:MAG: TonB-dependent receptor [Kofleriaceae bacterium]
MYYAVLTGAADSSGAEGQLLLGANAPAVRVAGRADPRHRAGEPARSATRSRLARIRADRADRRRFEDAVAMRGGELVASAQPTQQVLDTRAESTALAVYAQDRAAWGRVEVVAGARVEAVSTRLADRLGETVVDDGYAVVIPGGGVQVALTPTLAALAGVHRGFSPVAPGSAATPESSVNYEAGLRWRGARLAVDAIGFFSDYANLKGTCTFSTGCSAGQEGDEFDGGAVYVWGAELQAALELPLPRVRGVDATMPIELAYTYTGSSFRRAFASEFAGWDDVEVGDELPYLPAHQAMLSAAVVTARTDVGLAARYRSGSRDVAGAGPPPDDEAVEAWLAFDASVHVRPTAWAELYATASNLLDTRSLASRRPFGARPTAPRQLVVGYKGRF